MDLSSFSPVECTQGLKCRRFNDGSLLPIVRGEPTGFAYDPESAGGEIHFAQEFFASRPLIGTHELREQPLPPTFPRYGCAQTFCARLVGRFKIASESRLLVGGCSGVLSIPRDGPAEKFGDLEMPVFALCRTAVGGVSTVAALTPGGVKIYRPQNGRWETYWRPEGQARFDFGYDLDAKVFDERNYTDAVTNVGLAALTFGDEYLVFACTASRSIKMLNIGTRKVETIGTYRGRRDLNCLTTVLPYSRNGAMKIVVGGGFNMIDDIPARKLAEFDLESRTWSPCGRGSHGRVFSAAAIGENVLVAGYSCPELDHGIGLWDGQKLDPVLSPVRWVPGAAVVPTENGVFALAHGTGDDPRINPPGGPRLPNYGNLHCPDVYYFEAA